MARLNKPRSPGEASSEWLQALVDLAPDCIITIDEAGRIIEFNPAAEKTFGYRRAEILGQPMVDKIIPKRQREARRRGLTKFLSTGIPQMVSTRLEVTGMRADGSEFPVELTVITAHPEATPVYIAYLRDISEQKRAAEERLRHAEHLKRVLLHTALALARTVEIRDPYTAGHQRRVAHLAASIAHDLELQDQRVEGIFFGGLLHDIGKIAVPAEILSRPGKLADEDWAYLKTHCLKGWEIVKSIEFPWPVSRSPSNTMST